MGVSDLSSGDTISFSDINDELGNSSTATLDIKTAGDSFDGINTDGVYSITEFYGVSDASPAFSSFTVAGNSSTAGRIDINWGTSGPVDTFVLKRATNSDMDENVTTVGGGVNDGTHTDTGLSNTTSDGHASASPGKYFYQATATNTDPNPDNSVNSSVVSGLLLPTVTSPSATANTGIGGRIDLAWTNNGTITQVVVKRADNSGMSTNLATILTDTSDPFATSFSDTGQSGTKYYRIDITNATGTTNSSVVNATATSAIARTIEQGLQYGKEGETDETVFGWATDELILCVEDTNSATDPSFGTPDSLENTISYALTTTSGGWNNGSVAKLQSDGTTVFDGDARFWRNNNDEKIHQIAANGVISNTISYTPATLTISLVSKTSDSVTVRATGNTQVAKTLRFYRDTTEGTKTDHTKGAVGNTNVTADFTFSGLAGNTSYAFKVRGENAEKNGADSNTINVTTDTSGWTSVPADFNMHITDALNVTVDSTTSSLKTATLVGGSGTTQVSCGQPTSTAAMRVALSTSGDPGTSGTDNSGTGFAPIKSLSHSSGTLYMRFNLDEQVNSAPFGDPNGEDLTITFNNGSGTHTDTTLQINAKIVEDK